MSPVPDPALPVVYWRPGCPYCAALKLRLRLARIPFRAVNIWQDGDAGALVRSHNDGDEIVPTVQIGATMLTNPGVGEIRRTLGDNGG